MKKKQLTEVQEETLDYIKEYIDDNDESPMTSEIADYFDISSGAASGRVQYLVDAGYIKINKKKTSRKLVLK